MKFLIPASILTVFALIGSCASIGTYNDLTRQEKGVTAVWRDSAVQYDTFWKKVKETAQVTDAYKDAFKEVFLASVEARYEGKDPAVSLIMEANPTLSPEVYLQVQRVIETGRNDFAQTQRSLVDRQRAYSSSLTVFPNNVLAGVFGFPHELLGEMRPEKDLDGDGVYSVLDYPTVTSSATKEAFQKGEADEINVFGSK